MEEKGTTADLILVHHVFRMWAVDPGGKMGTLILNSALLLPLKEMQNGNLGSWISEPFQLEIASISPPFLILSRAIQPGRLKQE